MFGVRQHATSLNSVRRLICSDNRTMDFSVSRAVTTRERRCHFRLRPKQNYKLYRYYFALLRYAYNALVSVAILSLPRSNDGCTASRCRRHAGTAHNTKHDRTRGRQTGGHTEQPGVPPAPTTCRDNTSTSSVSTPAPSPHTYQLLIGLISFVIMPSLH